MAQSKNASPIGELGFDLPGMGGHSGGGGPDAAGELGFLPGATSSKSSEKAEKDEAKAKAEALKKAKAEATAAEAEAKKREA